jgi:uncharacterized protein YceK
MDARRSNPAIKLLPSLTDFAFLMPMVFLFGRMEGAKTLLGDCDTGWHIRTGEWILANHAVPTRDLFSFSKPGGPWYAWEWLSDVIWAWLHSRGGLGLVALAGVLLLCATFTVVFRLARRKANPIVALAVTMVAAACSSVHWLARPHLFTLLFAALFYAALERVRDGQTRWGRAPYLLILPVAMVLWTNLHGGFFVGILMIAAYGCAELLKLALASGSEDRAAARRNAPRYFLSAAGCAAASLANPYFYHLHAHILSYLRDPVTRNIMEFSSLDFHHPLGMFYEGLLAAAVAAALWNAAKGRYVEPLLMVVWAHGALVAVRNFPIFAILAAPPVAAMAEAGRERLASANVAGWLRTAARRFNRVAAETAETDALGRWHVVSALGALAVAALLLAPNPPRRFRAEFDPKSFPAGAVETLRGYPDARTFTYDQWGDYLIYRGYPQAKVFVDGRSDYYGAEFEGKVADVEQVKYDWERTLNGFAIDTILLPPRMALAGALKESRRWRLVYDDGVALVFRSAAAGGREKDPVALGDGTGRDREVTKIEARDRAITSIRHKAT